MDTALYEHARKDLLDGRIDWLADTIKCVLLAPGIYTPDLKVRQTLADIPAQARIAVSDALGGKALVNGVASADDSTIPHDRIESGLEAAALVIYHDAGTESDSQLIAWIEKASGLPTVTKGWDIIIEWDRGPKKIFDLKIATGRLVA